MFWELKTDRINLNDKEGNPFTDFYRRIGFISISVGINLYTGVEPLAVRRK